MFTIGTLANIKHVLQKELFNSSNERILSVCTVTKTFKKKKTCYLCIVSTPPRTNVTICQIKQYEKGEYKRKRSWELSEVRLVDGKSESTETHEFDIQLDKLYKWHALNLHERQNFLGVLYKHIQKYVKGEKPEFKNIPIAWISEKSPEKVSADKTLDKCEETSDDDGEYEDFHALTEKEISDLDVLVSECTYAISNAELFIEQLGKKLHDLDGVI